MRLQRMRRERGGATLVESAVVLFVFLTLVLGLLDLGLAVFRYHLVSEAARQGSRQAIVHGALAPRALGQWGPAAIDVTANTTGVPLVDAVRPVLIGFDLNQTRVQGVWLDGSNAPGNRVQVTISTPYRPMMTFIFGSAVLNLRGSSIVPICH